MKGPPTARRRNPTAPLLLALGGSAAALVLAALWTARDARSAAAPPQAEERADSLATQEGEPVPPAEGGLAREPVAAPPPAPADGSGTLVVLVALSDGRPAAGLAVSLALGAEGELSPLELATDEAGRAVFEVAAGIVQRSVRAAATPSTTPAGRWLDQKSRAGAVVEVALRVSPGWPLAGRVLGPEGDPVPGAEVLGWCDEYGRGEPERTVLADQDGAFRLEHLGPRFRVTARAPGLACSLGLRGELSGAVQAEGLTIQLAPERRMHGVVLDPQRHPIEGASVWVEDVNFSTSERNRTPVPGVLTFAAGQARTSSDAQGRFELRGLSHDQHYLNVARAPYLVDRRWRSTGEEPHEIVLDGGLSLGGRVLDAAGGPAAGARVRFWPFLSNVHTVEREVECDEQGRFLLKGLSLEEGEATDVRALEDEETPYAIAVHHAGHALHVLQPVRPSRQGGEHVEIRLSAERVLAGRVVDRAGAPAAGVDVWIEGDREMDVGTLYHRRSTWEFCNDVADDETDEQGRFRFERLYDGRFTVHAVFHDDSQRTASVETRSGNEAIELVLDHEATSRVVLVGAVRDGRTGQPVTRFILTPMVAGQGFQRTIESADGRFEVSGLPPGPIAVQVRAPGYAERRLAVADYAEGEHRLDVALLPRRVLELRVVDGQGAPHEHGSVQALDGARQPLPLEGPNWTTDREQLRQGRATLHGLPAEPIFLRVSVGPREEPLVREIPVDLTEPLAEPYEVVVGP